MSEKRKEKKEKKDRSRSKAETEALKRKLRQYVRVHAKRFLEDKNITSVGIGYRIDDGKPTKELCVQFTVASKPEVSGVALEELDTTPIPETLDIGGEEIPTDVIQRDFKLAYTLEAPPPADPRKARVNELKPGVSVSHPSGTAGTLGLIVYDLQTGDPCMLSNWHVLHRAQGKIGDDTVQPGPFDDNDVRRNRAGQLIRSHLGPPGDCAISRIEDRDFDDTPLDLGARPTGIGRADLDDLVIKSGRTTGVTRGIVRRTDVMTRIDYGGEIGPVDIGGFEIGPAEGAGPGYEVSMGGDSGSAWFFEDEEGESTGVLAGLHFAGESGMSPDEHAIACYAHSVFQKLRIGLEAPGEVEDVARGYDPLFTSTEAPRPWLTDEHYDDAVKLGASPMIPYTHFSVCLSRERRLARFVAWNIDGSRIKRLSREGIDFEPDPRVPADCQWDDDLYSHNALDRGHIARRADLVWGPQAEAQRANEDSFFFTNIAPQHESFNRSNLRGIWGELENAVFADVDVENLRVSVMGGPIFKEGDPVYRGARIPRDFWKLLAFTDSADGTFKTAAYILTQRDLLTDLEALDLDPFRVYQVSVEKLEEETQLEFRGLDGFDTFTPGPEMEAVAEGMTVSAREILAAEEILKNPRAG
jgi:endonuclease G